MPTKIFYSVRLLSKELKKLSGKKVVVLTGGAFDLFHSDHIHYLERAKSKGDVLIVHVDGDKFVKEKKGMDRPIIGQEERAKLIAALNFVDYVLITNEIYYAEIIISQIVPNIVVRVIRQGENANEKMRVMSNLVSRYPKMKVVFQEESESLSTTKLISKVRFPLIEVSKLSAEDKRLVNKAKLASKSGYSYSGFQAGAAVLSVNGKIFTGCNLSNSSPSVALCAERMAIAKMVETGERIILKIALFTNSQDFSTPCGICRQVVSEFSVDGKTRILLACKSKITFAVTSIDQLLPLPFRSIRANSVSKIVPLRTG